MTEHLTAEPADPIRAALDAQPGEPEDYFRNLAALRAVIDLRDRNSAAGPIGPYAEGTIDALEEACSVIADALGIAK